jgi:hypothetical protein
MEAESCGYGDELGSVSAGFLADGHDLKLTMPEASTQKMMDKGRATMYLAPPVKLRRRKMLPANPQASDMPLRMSSLSCL